MTTPNQDTRAGVRQGGSHIPAAAGAGREDDWELVAAAQAGQAEALGQLYSRYQRRIAGLVYRHTRDQELSADLSAETFARALGSLDRAHPGREDAWPWLSRIATNLVHDHRKRAETRLTEATARLPEPRAQARAELAQDAGERALDRMDARGAQATVGRLLAGLPPAQREALDGWMAERPNAETAAQVGRSPAAVKEAAKRARHTIRARLSAEGITGVEQAIAAGHRDAERLDQALARARRGVCGLRARVDHTAADARQHQHNQDQDDQRQRELARCEIEHDQCPGEGLEWGVA